MHVVRELTIKARFMDHGGLVVGYDTRAEIKNTRSDVVLHDKKGGQVMRAIMDGVLQLRG